MVQEARAREPDDRAEHAHDQAARVSAESPPQTTDQPDAAPDERRRRRRRWLIRAGIAAAVVIAIVLALFWWFDWRLHESTDDAFIDGHVIMIAPQVAGPVLRVDVTDNQHVHAGDLLVEIDPTDYRIALSAAEAALASAQARLGQAQAQLESAQAGVGQAQADVTAAAATEANARQSLQRYENAGAGAVSAEQLGSAQATARTAAAQLQASRERLASAQSQVGLGESQVRAAQAEAKQAQVNVEQARQRLGYTTITAPSDGRITNRSVEVGNYVQAGQALLALVAPEVWVTANFKETQLTYMRPGQPVDIQVDAYPGQTFRGHVDSIQAGTGARFSLLPPENATGNYVKVVQRVPVKIVFDDPIGLGERGAVLLPAPSAGGDPQSAPPPAQTREGFLLAPGMSVTPRVRVR